MTATWSEYLKQIMAGQNLDRSQAQALMTGWLEGQIPPEISGAILVAWQYRGIQAQELAGLAAVLLSQSMGQGLTRPELPVLLDTCGTGGDGAGTFNISTAVALVVASGGVPVAKHGNRAVSSRSGSADVLEALGINLNTDLQRITSALTTVGITFLFAPHWHPAMKAIAPLRQSLGIRTVFNLLGPLVNPLQPTVQILGVYSRALVKTVAEALQMLGRERAICLHSREGLDEISLGDITDGAMVANGEVTEIAIDPQALGIQPAPLTALRGGDVAQNAAILTDILQGKGEPAQGDCVAINSAYALYIAGKVSDPHAGLLLARELLRSGAGWDKLAELKQFLNA
ncbi:MAG: anthranilate phosphoribosyltransferase [Pseudanabaenaceae cyanobacterium]